MPLILGTNSIKDTGFDVANSVRFNKADAPALKRNSMGTATNRKKWTLSMWVKRSTTAQAMLVSFDGAKSYFQFQSGGQLEVNDVPVSTFNYRLVTNAVYRDVSAWMHIVIAFDSTQGTDSNRLKLYVNGEQPSLGTATYPSLNFEPEVNSTGSHKYGSYDDSTDFAFDGYFAEIVFIDGTQYAASDFGEFDEDSGIWKPKDPSGLTFGTNGHYLDFEDSSNLGNDANGGTDFDENNITATDQSTDTCTNNFATLNPLTKSSATFSEGNLKQGGAGASAVATFGVSSGKWYFEQKILGGNNEAHLGFALENSSIFKDNVTGSTVRGSGYVSLYSFDGKIYNEGSATSSFGTFSANDIISFALDVDAGNIFLYQNGTVLNGGSAVVSGKTGKTWFPFGNFDAGNVTGIEHNFGGTQTFTISSGNSDGNSKGNFEYAVPSGYFALCTSNLAEHG